MRWNQRFSQFTVLALFGLAACLAACGPSAPVQAAVIVITATPSPTPNVTATPTRTATAAVTLPATLTPTPSLTPTPTCGETKGSVTKERLASPAMEFQFIPYRLYLPPCYESHTWQRYPVLYLIHGLNMNESAWDDLGADEMADELIASGDAPPFIIVMPRAPDDARFTETMAFDLVPFIDKEYRTLPDREFRSLGGMSRGGGWTVRIGLQYPDLFSSLGLHSLAIFYADENKVVGWLNRLPDDKLPRIYMDIGKSDTLMESATWFDQALTDRFIDHQYIIRPGRHEDSYWKEHLEEYMRWYTENW